jgi:DNA-binding transcriptional MocR family regulator
MQKEEKLFRYRQLAREFEQNIMNGTYRPGEKLPSLRTLHQRLNLSISTVYQAYVELEAMGLIEARPKSGYYVAPVTLRNIPAPVFKKISQPPRKVRLSSMINSVLAALNNPNLLPLGSTVVDAALLPTKKFAELLKGVSPPQMSSLLSYSFSEGYPELRRQLALWTLGVLKGVTSEDIIITNGCTEALALALLAITRPGDTVAIETPTNFSFLQLLKELGLIVLEVPTNPINGLDLDELKKHLVRNTITACLLMPNFHNPLGAIMPDEKKEALVKLINTYGVPVIEDDISAELYFNGKRPRPLKAFDHKDLVITCASFSKTLAPGLRIGWIICGKRYLEKIQRLKAGINISTSTLDQYLISAFLASGAYERHLRSLRNTLKSQVFKTALAIQAHFPPDTRLAVPKGGSLLWVQLPPGIDGLLIYQKALVHNISIIPGIVCSNSRQFKNHIQISCGVPFTPAVEKGIKTLGAIACGLYNANYPQPSETLGS